MLQPPVRGQKDNWNLKVFPVLANHGGQLESIAFGHVDVHQDGVRIDFPDRGHRAHRIGHHLGFHAGLFQQKRIAFGHVGIVIHHHHPVGELVGHLCEVVQVVHQFDDIDRFQQVTIATSPHGAQPGLDITTNGEKNYGTGQQPFFLQLLNGGHAGVFIPREHDIHHNRGGRMGFHLTGKFAEVRYAFYVEAKQGQLRFEHLHQGNVVVHQENRIVHFFPGAQFFQHDLPGSLLHDGRLVAGIVDDPQGLDQIADFEKFDERYPLDILQPINA